MGPHRPPSPTELNTIVNSFNRNFPKRNDGNANTKAFVTSPDMVIAYALAGTLDFDPVTDSLTTGLRGAACGSTPPSASTCPSRRLRPRRVRLRRAPRATASEIAIAVSPTSDRLQLLTPFPAWDGNDYVDLPVLLEGQGQVHDRPHLGRRPLAPLPRPPREHLGQPVPRRRQRLHGRDRRGQGPARRRRPAPFPDIAKHLGPRPACGGARSATRTTARARRASTPPWSPATAAALVILARSFARIHETNLKKQGMLPLTFADPTTYDLIGEDDRISVLDLASLGARRAGALPRHQARRHPGRVQCTPHVQP